MGHFKNLVTDLGTVGEAMEDGRYNRRSSTATATRPAATKTSTRLWVKQINERIWHVECGSRQHMYHSVVRSVSTGNLICDSACWEFKRKPVCPHIAAVLNELNGPYPKVTAVTSGELLEGDEYDTLDAGDGPVLSDNCCYDAGNQPGNLACLCVCHSLLGGSLPASLPFVLGASVVKRVDCALSDMFDDIA